jgi:hypothetical protein
MPDAKSGRVHILRQLAVPGGVAAEDTGNHFLLSLTRRSERCRSGSEISGAGLYQRQGAERRSRGVEGCGIRDELNGLDVICTTPAHPSKIELCRNFPRSDWLFPRASPLHSITNRCVRLEVDSKKESNA